MQSDTLGADLQPDKFWHVKSVNSICFNTDNLLELMDEVRQIFDLTTFNINKILTQEFLLNILCF